MSTKFSAEPVLRRFIRLTQYDALEPTPIYIRCADISAITPVKIVQYDGRGYNIMATGE